ncbi:MAG: response regulator transcription factor [Dehalococcoidales bacterium]|nr:MAG: response regulator transcription factor [Dehalococcoidales bacterium]
MSIRILLAEDHKMVREGLRGLLESQPDMEVVAEAGDGRAAMQLVQETSPDVVVMDVVMPDLNGIEATRQVVVRSPGVKVVALSMYSDTRFITGMLSAGASGYVLKDCAIEELVQAIHTVAENQTYLSPGITQIVVRDYIDHLDKMRPSAFSLLTAREREVLQLLAEGMTMKEIAYQLDLGVKTVETHRQQIMEKLDTHSIAELTKYAIREGLTSLDK